MSLQRFTLASPTQQSLKAWCLQDRFFNPMQNANIMLPTKYEYMNSGNDFAIIYFWKFIAYMTICNDYLHDWLLHFMGSHIKLLIFRILHWYRILGSLTSWFALVPAAIQSLNQWNCGLIFCMKHRKHNHFLLFLCRHSGWNTVAVAFTGRLVFPFVQCNLDNLMDLLLMINLHGWSPTCWFPTVWALSILSLGLIVSIIDRRFSNYSQPCVYFDLSLTFDIG